MGKLSGFMGGLHGIANWFMRISITNIIWVILNIPLFLVVFSAIQHDESMGMILYLLPALILVPSILYPSTHALFATARDWMMEREQASLIKSYFSYFKNDYKQSLLSGLVWTVIWIICIIDIIYFYQKSDLITIIFLIAGLILLVMNINYFSIQAHFHMKIKEVFKNAFFVTIGSPMVFFSVSLANIIIVMATMEIWFLFPFFSATLSVLVSFYVFYRFSLKIRKRQQLAEANE